MTMKELAWLMPLLFILHDMEEIVFGMAWKKDEPSMKKYTKAKLIPFGTSKDTAGMSFAIYEELLHKHAHSFSDILNRTFSH